jgi:hypothetical protein
MHVWREQLFANYHFKVVLCIEFYPLQRIMQNKVVAASDRYYLDAPGVRYIIYWCVLMLFYVQGSLFTVLTPFANVFASGTLPMRSH